MTYLILNHEQGSPQWHKARLGKVTASIFSSIITKTGKQSASIDMVVNRAVAELIKGETDDFFLSEAMIRGSELEDEAFNFFNFSKDLNLKKVGFAQSVGEDGQLMYFGCSADGLAVPEGYGGEFKCPSAHTHLAYLAAEALPDAYKQQVQGTMELLGLERYFFGSYHPGFPPLELFIDKDYEYCEKLRSCLNYCDDNIRAKLELFEDRYGLKVAA